MADTTTAPDTSCDAFVPWNERDRAVALLALVASRDAEVAAAHSLYCAHNILCDVEEVWAEEGIELTGDDLMERAAELFANVCHC